MGILYIYIYIYICLHTSMHKHLQHNTTEYIIGHYLLKLTEAVGYTYCILTEE